MPVRVVSAEESVALDAAAIASGIPSRALMRAAAFNAATIISARYADLLSRGVLVYTGSGNNGGDGWALASALHAAGVRVHVREIAAARSPDAVTERGTATQLIASALIGAGIVIDAMIGTGNTGTLSGAFLQGAREIADARSNGSVVVALDLPSGVNATSGATPGAVVADLTISFGSCKRGSLISRAECGEIVIVDIGLGAPPASPPTTLPTLVDASFVKNNTPRIAPDAHKGTRKSVAIVAGADRMGGAAILAATGALRSGAGLVKVITASANISAVHSRIPEALVGSLDEAASSVRGWADVVLIGPGLPSDVATRSFIRNLLAEWRGPVVVDAGAINAFDGDLTSLGSTLRGRPAILTPHPGEFARLVDRDVKFVLDNRFDIGLDVAREVGAAVLLKGTPTVVCGSDGTRHVVAAGTQVLATGGSGDALGGIVATLLAQGCAPDTAAACAAWVHGRAAELTPGVRGYRLTDVLERLPDAWKLDDTSLQYPAVASLPRLP